MPDLPIHKSLFGRCCSRQTKGRRKKGPCSLKNLQHTYSPRVLSGICRYLSVADDLHQVTAGLRFYNRRNWRRTPTLIQWELSTIMTASLQPVGSPKPCGIFAPVGFFHDNALSLPHLISIACGQFRPICTYVGIRVVLFSHSIRHHEI